MYEIWNDGMFLYSVDTYEEAQAAIDEGFTIKSEEEYYGA